MTQLDIPVSELTSQTQSGRASLATEDNTTPLRDEICDHNGKGLTQYTCPKCQEALNQQFDDVLRGVMIREGWTEDEVNAVSLRQFAKKSMAELVPDPTGSEEVQTRVYGRNCVDELQSRIDTTREIHAARTRM